MTCQFKWKTLVAAVLLTMVLGPLGGVQAQTEKADKAEAKADAKADKTEGKAAAKGESAEAKAAVKPANVADVNGTVIAYADYERQMEIMKQRVLRGRPGQVPESMMKQMQSQVIQQMVAEELLFQESRKKGIEIGPEAIEAELLNLKQRFGTEEQYQKTLSLMKLTEEGLKGQIAHQAAIRKLVETEIAPQVKVEDAEIKKYFDENTDKFRKPERVRASHILIKVDKADDDKKKADARKKLEDIKKKIMAGEDFAKLAGEHSEGPTKTRGGDLGFFTRGRMVKSFEDVAFKLAPNEVSDVVETKFGYHLIKVVEHQQAEESKFDDVKEQISKVLERQGIQKLLEPYVEKLRAAGKVKTFLP